MISTSEYRRLHVFADAAVFGRRLARAMGVPSAPVHVHRFPDRETLVRVATPPGRHAIIVRSLVDPNVKLLETVMAADAARRAGARRVTLVAPYLCYMRQDRVFHPGEAVSQHVVGAWLGSAFDAVLTVEAHLHRVHQLRDVVPCRARSLSAAAAIAEWVRRGDPATVIVGPDAESAPWIRRIGRVAARPWLVGEKDRFGDRRVRVCLPPVPPCRRAVIVDDIASSGETLAAAAVALRRAGVRRVEAVVVHAIFAPGALRRIHGAGVRRVVSCDTVPHATNAIACAPVIAAALGIPRPNG